MTARLAIPRAQPKQHLTVVVAIGVLAGMLFAGGDARANGGAKYDFRLSPRIGTPTTKFRATFSAPYEGEYVLEAVGPRRCASIFEFTSPVDRGDRVVMRLTAFDDLYFGIRRRWCRGSYAGYVYWVAPADRPDRLIGYFVFGVGRSPVSLGG